MCRSDSLGCAEHDRALALPNAPDVVSGFPCHSAVRQPHGRQDKGEARRVSALRCSWLPELKRRAGWEGYIRETERCTEVLVHRRRVVAEECSPLWCDWEGPLKVLERLF